MTHAAELRYAAGQASQQDVLKAQTQLILLEARREKYAQERESREAEINAILARPLSTPVARPPEEEEREALASLDELMRAAEAHAPAIGRERAQVERAELALNLARKDGSIDYTVGAGWASMGSMGSMYQAKVDFNVPLFTRSRQRAAVLEQVAQGERARRGYQATGNQLLFQIKDDWLQSASAWRLMQLYSTTLLPQARLTLDAARNAYQNGQGELMNVLSSMMAVLDAEMAYHEELLNHHLALLRLEEATGVPMLAGWTGSAAQAGPTRGGEIVDAKSGASTRIVDAAAAWRVRVTPGESRGLRVVGDSTSRVDTSVDSAGLGACATLVGASFWRVPMPRAGGPAPQDGARVSDEHAEGRR
jgi:outer membrane protein TolC